MSRTTGSEGRAPVKVCCVICHEGVCRPRVCELVFIGDEAHLVIAWETRADGTRVPSYTVQIRVPDLVRATSGDDDAGYRYPSVIRAPAPSAPAGQYAQ